MQIPDHAPFSQAERAAFNQLLATLKPEQSLWLSGFFAGVSSSSLPAAAATAAPKPELTILYGTESGNSEKLADETGKLAAKAGFKPRIVNMSDTSTKKLAGVKNLLVIVSTWGDGDPPDTATAFYKDIMGDGAAKFTGTRFSVCALGDTSYEKFCETGKRIDARLEQLGAARILPRQDCDVDFEANYNAWVQAALAAFPVEKPTVSAPAGVAAVSSSGKLYSLKNPFPAPIKSRVVLNGTGSAKETLHIELSLEGSGLTYEVGDALAVIPQNRDLDVERVLAATGLSSQKINGKPIFEALQKDFDITSLTSLIAGKYNAIANNKKLADLLAPERKKDFSDWAYGRQLVDLLEEYPCKELTAESFTGLLRKMAPRLYSIASSLKAHEDEVHLTVAAVRYHSHGRDRVGVASTYLADLVDCGDPVPVYLHSNKNFRLPADNSAPIIMIGPGTGIAPFRAFVEERRAIGATGKNWLFFGDQRYSFDFLYQLEWQDHLKEGFLHRLDVAFSRDQPHKIYVQDKMRAAAKEIYQWIQEGAYLYVCGDASRMAHDVNTAFIDIIAQHGGKSPEEAEAFLGELKKAKRYQRDVY